MPTGGSLLYRADDVRVSRICDSEATYTEELSACSAKFVVVCTHSQPPRNFLKRSTGRRRREDAQVGHDSREGGSLTAGVVMHSALGKHGVVLDLRLSEGRAVAADDNQLS